MGKSISLALTPLPTDPVLIMMHDFAAWLDLPGLGRKANANLLLEVFRYDLPERNLLFSEGSFGESL